MGTSGGGSTRYPGPQDETGATVARAVAIGILRQFQAFRAHDRQSTEPAQSSPRPTMASEGKSAKDGADDRSVAVPPEAAAAGEKRFSPDPDEEDVEAIEFVRRLQAEGPIGKMTTANTEYNPKKLSHSWKLDLETGLPDVEGLSRADLLTG